jgi:PAS domain S-box-containing protein
VKIASKHLHRIFESPVQTLVNHAQKTLTRKKYCVFEDRVIRSDGQARYLKSWGIPFKIIGASMDIKNNKQTENRLKVLHAEVESHLNILALSEKKYSDLFHLSPLPMWVFELDTLKFLNVNDAAINHYGYTEDDFLNMTIRDIRPNEERVKVEETINLLKTERGLSSLGVFKHQKKNGEIIQVQIQSNAINFNGKSSRLVLAVDITERQNYIDAIERQNKRLQDIAWIQSHVVRVPLARIMSLIDLFKHYKIEDPDQRQLMDNILRSANELDEVVRDISDKTDLYG